MNKPVTSVTAKTPIGTAKIVKSGGGYMIQIRETAGYGSPRHARTLTEARAIASKLETNWVTYIARLHARNAEVASR